MWNFSAIKMLLNLLSTSSILYISMSKQQWSEHFERDTFSSKLQFCQLLQGNRFTDQTSRTVKGSLVSLVTNQFYWQEREQKQYLSWSSLGPFYSRTPLSLPPWRWSRFSPSVNPSRTWTFYLIIEIFLINISKINLLMTER